MKIEKKKLSELSPYPKNIRKHPEKQIQELVKSIKKYGQVRPIVTDENGVILAGHGLFEALKSMESESADVLVMKGLSENDKKKLLLADNKIYSMGFDVYANIEEMLTEFGIAGDFEIPGYDSEVLEEMYGIKEMEQEIETSGTPAQRAVASMQETVPESEPEPAKEAQPSLKLEEARAEAQRQAEQFVICPNCGEKVYF